MPTVPLLPRTLASRRSPTSLLACGARITSFLRVCRLGPKFKLALKLAKDHRFKRLTCSHKGTYADDCLIERVSQHKCYIVATCDRDLKRRIRKVPGVPIMYITARKYSIERMPDAFGAPRNG